MAIHSSSIKISVVNEKKLSSVWAIFLLALSASFSLFVSIGVGRFGYPPLISSLVTMKWVTNEQADYLGATNLAGYIIGALLASRLLNSSLGPYRVVMGSLAIAIISFVFCAFHPEYIWFLFWRFISGVAGGVIMITAAPTILALMAAEHKGFVSGVIFAGVGLGIVFSGTVIPLLVNRGLAMAWFSYAMISTILFVFVGILFPKKKSIREYTQVCNNVHIPIDKKLVILMIAYACNAIAFIPHTLFWVDFIDRGLHMSLATGNHYWILYGLSAMAGPVVIGFTIDKTGFTTSVVISGVLRCAGMVLPVFWDGPAALVISTVCVGCLSIGYTSLIATRVQSLYEDIKRIWAWLTVAYALSHALAGYFFSYLFSQFSNYQMIFLVGAGIMAAGCLLDYWGAVSVKALSNRQPAKHAAQV